MPRNLDDVKVEKIDLTLEQQQIVKDLFGVELPLQVTVVREKSAQNTDKRILITDEIEEQEALNATCVCWC